MGLMIPVAAASLGCMYMLFFLHFCGRDANVNARPRKTNSAPPRTPVFLLKRETGNPARDVAQVRRKETGELRLSREPAVESDTKDSEILVRQRIVQIFATRVAQRREK